MEALCAKVLLHLHEIRLFLVTGASARAEEGEKTPTFFWISWFRLRGSGDDLELAQIRHLLAEQTAAKKPIVGPG